MRKRRTFTVEFKGNVYDNVMVESFIQTLKYEEVYLWEYRTLADVESRLPYFIEEVYNQKRLHSALGYRPPNEFEVLLQVEQNGVPVPQTALIHSVQTQGVHSRESIQVRQIKKGVSTCRL